MREAIRWILRVTGALMVANGAWMLLDAIHWFQRIPAGLPDTGAANGHLIRDVGLVYVVLGGALLWSVRNLPRSRPVFLCVAAFMVGHAVAHVLEICVGLLPLSHLKLDFPVVVGPGIFFAVISLPYIWRWLTRTEQ